MVFTSQSFLIFFACFYSLYLLLQRLPNVRPQNILLLIASNIFYGAWDVRFLGLLWFSALIDFFVAQRIEDATEQRVKKRWLTFSITTQLLLLGTFKYLNFGIEGAVALIEAMGFEAHIHTLNIILPVGISFYTFQTIAYTIDVYRGKVKACRDPIDFALYVSFFPQLVAGPIETPGHLLPQLLRKRVIDQTCIRIGIYWILIGFFKKVVLADTLAPLVQHTFDHSDSISGVSSLIGIVAFSLQIYGDFAGYTFIARGVAKLMGIDLAVNFRRPYLATSPRDFWRRWHISLSNWLRDYLYISLGGSRRGPTRTYINLLLTMFLGGLWHGAAWNFAVWGVYHGTLLCVDHWLDQRGIRLRLLPAVFERANHVLSVAGMYVLTLGGWLFFRVTSMEQAGDILRNIFFNFHVDSGTLVLATPVVTLGVLLFGFHIAQERNKGDDLLVLSWQSMARVGLYAFICITILAVGLKPIPFIYFQF
jgi:D-alanyl-lipoteichoic acid acyltransferase DltB (MBOAT superfamily)